MKQCNKCASKNITTRFFPIGKTFYYPEMAESAKDFIKVFDGEICKLPFIIEKEHLIFTCNSCGYSIAKNTLRASSFESSQIKELSRTIYEIKNISIFELEKIKESILENISKELNREMSMEEVIKHLESAKENSEEELINDLNNIINFLNIETDKDIDERSVDIFSLKMKEKLKRAREKGRGGWYNKELCTDEELANLFKEHLSKANKDNFIDLANFLMFLYIREARDDIFLKDEKLSLLQHIIKNEKSF